MHTLLSVLQPRQLKIWHFERNQNRKTVEKPMKWTFSVCLTVRRKQTKVWRKLRKCQILLLNCPNCCGDQWILFNICDISNILSSVHIIEIFIDSLEPVVYIFTVDHEICFIPQNQIFIVIPIAIAKFYILLIKWHSTCSVQLKDTKQKVQQQYLINGN